MAQTTQVKTHQVAKGTNLVEVKGKQDNVLTATMQKYRKLYEDAVDFEIGATTTVAEKWRALRDAIVEGEPTPEARFKAVENLTNLYPNPPKLKDDATPEQKKEHSRAVTAYQYASRFKTIFGANMLAGVEIKGGVNKLSSTAKAALTTRNLNWKGEPESKPTAEQRAADKAAKEAYDDAIKAGKSRKEAFQLSEDAAEFAKQNQELERLKSLAKSMIRGWLFPSKPENQKTEGWVRSFIEELSRAIPVVQAEQAAADDKAKPARKLADDGKTIDAAPSDKPKASNGGGKRRG